MPSGGAGLLGRGMCSYARWSPEINENALECDTWRGGRRNYEMKNRLFFPFAVGGGDEKLVMDGRRSPGFGSSVYRAGR